MAERLARNPRQGLKKASQRCPVLRVWMERRDAQRAGVYWMGGLRSGVERHAAMHLLLLASLLLLVRHLLLVAMHLLLLAS